MGLSLSQTLNYKLHPVKLAAPRFPDLHHLSLYKLIRVPKVNCDSIDGHHVVNFTDPLNKMILRSDNKL